MTGLNSFRNRDRCARQRRKTENSFDLLDGDFDLGFRFGLHFGILCALGKATNRSDALHCLFFFSSSDGTRTRARSTPATRCCRSLLMWNLSELEISGSNWEISNVFKLRDPRCTCMKLL